MLETHPRLMVLESQGWSIARAPIVEIPIFSSMFLSVPRCFASQRLCDHSCLVTEYQKIVRLMHLSWLLNSY